MENAATLCLYTLPQILFGSYTLHSKPPKLDGLRAEKSPLANAFFHFMNCYFLLPSFLTFEVSTLVNTPFPSYVLNHFSKNNMEYTFCHFRDNYIFYLFNILKYIFIYLFPSFIRILKSLVHDAYRFCHDTIMP